MTLYLHISIPITLLSYSTLLYFPLPLLLLSSFETSALTCASRLLLTKETMMTLLSRPWYLSTVLTSTALKTGLSSSPEMAFSCCLYGAMMPMSPALQPA